MNLFQIYGDRQLTEQAGGMLAKHFFKRQSKEEWESIQMYLHPEDKCYKKMAKEQLKEHMNLVAEED